MYFLRNVFKFQMDGCAYANKNVIEVIWKLKKITLKTFMYAYMKDKIKYYLKIFLKIVVLTQHVKRDIILHF